MRRKSITHAKLYALLEREFRKRRDPRCASCQMPLPFHLERPDDVSANWHIGTPNPCEHGCQAVIAEIMAKLWTEYELAERVDSA